MLTVKQFTFNPFGESTYIVADPTTREAAIIDPGMVSAAERALLDSYIERNSLKVTQLINTHLHVDHCFAANYVRSRYGVALAGHPDDAFLGERVAQQTRTFGVIPQEGEPEKVSIDVPLKDGDTIAVGSDSLKVLHVPGHSPGSVALYSPTGGFVITGDALFQGSIGRTDLPGGSMPQLIDSIRRKLLTLPPETKVYPGHGPATTIAAELRYNPYLQM